MIEDMIEEVEDSTTYLRADILQLCREVDRHAHSGFVGEEVRKKIQAVTTILRHVVHETDLQEITVEYIKIRLRPPLNA